MEDPAIVNAVVDEKKLSTIRKYIYEVSLLALAACVVFLFMTYLKLQTYIRDTLFEQVTTNRVIIQQNSDLMKETNFLLMQRNAQEKDRR